VTSVRPVYRQRRLYVVHVRSAKINDDAARHSRFGSATDDQVGISHFIYVYSSVVLGMEYSTSGLCEL